MSSVHLYKQLKIYIMHYIKLLIYRVEYMEKSKHLQDQLRELKSEIEVLKVEEKSTDLDRYHEEGIQRGDTKYSTMRQVCYISIK